MPNFYSLIPSPTILVRQEDPLADPTPTIYTSQVSIIVDNTPLSPIAMIAIKIYAFGGLAFLFGVVLTGISYWIWVVVVKGEFADSPPGLDIHPERMREKEKARIVRLKAKKEKRNAERKRREEEKWRVPPLRCEKKAQSRPTTRTNHCPTKPAIRLPSARSTSASPAKKKQVSWATSSSTLDKEGNLSTKPLEDGEIDKDSRRRSNRRSLRPPLREVPPAHRVHPRTSISIEERSARGQELIGAMTPQVVSRWAQSPDY